MSNSAAAIKNSIQGSSKKLNMELSYVPSLLKNTEYGKGTAGEEKKKKRQGHGALRKKNRLIR